MLVSKIKNEQLHLFPVLLPLIISPPSFVCFGDSVAHQHVFTSKKHPYKKKSGEGERRAGKSRREKENRRDGNRKLVFVPDSGNTLKTKTYQFTFLHSQDAYSALCPCYDNLYKFFTDKTNKVLNRKKKSGRIISSFNVIQLCNNLVLSKAFLNLAIGYIQKTL